MRRVGLYRMGAAFCYRAEKTLHVGGGGLTPDRIVFYRRLLETLLEAIEDFARGILTVEELQRIARDAREDGL